MPLQDFYNKIVALEELDIVEEIDNIINSNSEFIADLLAQQLAMGVDADGERVTIYGRDTYKPSTIYQKKTFGLGLGKVTDRITNYSSGMFYRELDVKAVGEEFDIFSHVDYFQKIIARSGVKIMELNSEHLQIFRDQILIPQLKLRLEQIFA